MTFRRYFGIITTWYLHSHRTWDRLCHSCIGSSFLPRGAFPEGGAYSFHGGMHAGSLEALRVARPEAVGLAGTNEPHLAWYEASLQNNCNLNHIDPEKTTTSDGLRGFGCGGGMT